MSALASVQRSRNADRPNPADRGPPDPAAPRPGEPGARAGEPPLRTRAVRTGRAEAGGRLPRRSHHRRDRRVRSHRPGGLRRAARVRDAQPERRPGHADRRVLPRRLRLQHPPRWNHDAQFVIRLPERWNGGLVVAGSPGNRRQYANDVTISDWVLAQGYAYAATDKGNSGLDFHKDGRRPGDAVAEWNRRLTELTRAAQQTAARHYGHRPSRTYAAGISNGGYLVRWQLENRPRLYDGGIDAEGTLWRADGPNLFTYLPQILRAYPAYASGDASAHGDLVDAGLAPGSEFLWPYHDQVYWELTQRIYREEFDPGYEGAEAEYDFASRPREVRRAVDRVSLTGRIRKPLISLQGTYDSLLPIGSNGDAYAALVRDRGKAPFRYYRVEGANHTDGLVDAHPDRLRPLLPCMRSAFTALEAWTAEGTAPPPSATLPKPSGGTDTLNTCSLGS
ncbi:tannase/feruloyl esterase family alpha/beta hydrolase [Actinomadura sp. CNU-125]|uniref:tannase/feruloyl esterase family alpha/beta hydrolase n=1 Tax=Actinomadura sp. CNU-125 TaxID=1904961 RepID=UPI000AF191B9|nr:tannase/feruloyl esterase family alpha/beta hydrolase [Actinomadura sp. CNU-125]